MRSWQKILGSSLLTLVDILAVASLALMMLLCAFLAPFLIGGHVPPAEFFIVPLKLDYCCFDWELALIQLAFLAACEFGIFRVMSWTPLKWPVKLPVMALVWVLATAGSNVAPFAFFVFSTIPGITP